MVIDIYNELFMSSWAMLVLVDLLWLYLLDVVGDWKRVSAHF